MLLRNRWASFTDISPQTHSIKEWHFFFLSALFQLKQSIFYCEGTQDILKNLLEDVQGFLKDNASLKFTSQSITLRNCILWRNICVTFLESLIFWAFSQLLLSFFMHKAVGFLIIKFFFYLVRWWRLALLNRSDRISFILTWVKNSWKLI